MCSDYDPPTLAAITWHKAAKPHQCDECLRTIAAGERYEKVFHLQDPGDSPCTFKTCGQCVEARMWLQEECSGWIYTMVAEDLDEHDEQEPRRLAALMRGQWLVRGRLLPPEEVAVAFPVHAPPERRRSDTVTM